MKPINVITAEDVSMFRAHTPRESDTSQGNALDLYQRLATKSAIYPGQGTALGLVYVALKLNGEAGELAEHVGKAMRDDGLVRTTTSYGTGAGDVFMSELLDPQRRASIGQEIGDALWYLSALCNELGLDMSAVAAANLTKLQGRSERGTLHGSGDSR